MFTSYSVTLIIKSITFKFIFYVQSPKTLRMKVHSEKRMKVHYNHVECMAPKL